MNAIIYISGKIGQDTTLVDVIRQYKSFESPEAIQVNIHSEGGSVEEGDNIYNYLNSLKNEVTVNTYTDKAYSIAAKVFSVGQERIIENLDKALMIHFAWADVQGNADKLEVVAIALRELENTFAFFYSEFLDVDEKTIRKLLDNETFISGSDAVELGFATEIKVTAEAVAEYNIEKSKNQKMTKDKKEKGFFKKLVSEIQAYLNEEESVEVNAELTLQDSNGSEVVFPDIESGEAPKVGDAATMDGAAIADGSYIMPSLEDATVVFVDGKISEIIPKEEETAEEKEIDVDAEANFEELLEKVTTKVSEKIRTEIQAEFNTKLSEKETEIVALKKQIGSKEFNAEQRENERKTVNLSGQASVLYARKKSN